MFNPYEFINVLIGLYSLSLLTGFIAFLLGYNDIVVGIGISTFYILITLLIRVCNIISIPIL